MTQQQQPRSSFEALTQAMGVGVLRAREAQIQREISESGQPEWWVRQVAYRKREAERQAMTAATNARAAELRNPHLRAAREAREAEEQASAARAAHAAWQNDPGRRARWRDYVQAHPYAYDALGRVKWKRDPASPEAWFELG
jgi:hypothetical protein